MNRKFYNRRLKPGVERGGRTRSAISLTKATDVLKEAENAWWGLSEVRKKAARSQMYGFEDQWGDLVIDPASGKKVTESAYIRSQGKVPLKNNVIRPILKNIDGQFRNNQTKPVCVVRDKRESKIGEMMSIAIEYCHQINETTEMDAASLTNLMLSGLCAQRVEYGMNPAKQNLDVWVYPTNTYRLFFNTDIEDPRTWDLRIIGEMYDMTLSDIVAAFARDKTTCDDIYRIYGDHNGATWADSFGLQGDQNKNMDFYMPSRPDLCRVILVWKKESREALFCRDLLSGEWWYSNLSDRKSIDVLNKQRMEEALANGMDPEDVLLVEYTYSIEQYWYYRYMTPFGDVLQEGRSPYWHKEHNYILNIYPFVNGKVFNFVDDFIDQQKYINRTLTMIDFIRSSTAKGLLIVDEDAFQGMSREQIVDEYVRYNGVLFVRLKQGQNIHIIHIENGLQNAGYVHRPRQIYENDIKICFCRQLSGHLACILRLCLPDRINPAPPKPLLFQQHHVLLVLLHHLHVPFPQIEQAALGGVTINDGHTLIHRIIQETGKRYQHGTFADPTFLVADRNE